MFSLSLGAVLLGKVETRAVSSYLAQVPMGKKQFITEVSENCRVIKWAQREKGKKNKHLWVNSLVTWAVGSGHTFGEAS